jgi:ribosomal protein L11 methyltransferase
MDWLEITVNTTHERLEELMCRLNDLGVTGLIVNDEASVREFLDNNPASWDYVDDEVFDALRGKSSLQFFLEDNEEGVAQLSEYESRLPEETFSVRRVRDEDWLNNWKQYFKPIEIGRRLLIVPEWEPVPENTGRTILRIEPQLAFGTGAHASTRMCLEELENHSAANVLDLGCGSGILAVAALLYGAAHAVCCDIAPDAAAVCHGNAISNGIDPDRLDVYTGNILSGNTLDDAAGNSRYGIVFANIIADVIIPLALHVKNLLTADGVFICSGIIDGRQEEVRSALEKSGLEIIRARQSENWHMFAARAVVLTDQI